MGMAPGYFGRWPSIHLFVFVGVLLLFSHLSLGEPAGKRLLYFGAGETCLRWTCRALLWSTPFQPMGSFSLLFFLLSVFPLAPLAGAVVLRVGDRTFPLPTASKRERGSVDASSAACY